MLQGANSTLRICIKVRKTIFKSTLRTVDAVESVSYCVQQESRSSRMHNANLVGILVQLDWRSSNTRLSF